MRIINCEGSGAKMATQAEEDEKLLRGFVILRREIEKSPHRF